MTDKNINKLLIRKERRSALGKLLAKENIDVQHGNYRTAYFDVKNRVLGLPDWSDKSKSVYDMLLGHEVGHALYTPARLFEDESIRATYKNFDIINVLEDIRIERMIQETYPGLPRYFKEGYTELYESNFFDTDGDDISDYSFLDRLNLHAKIGSIIDVPLSDEELEIYNKAYKAKTFDEVLALYDEVLSRLDDEKLEKDEDGNRTMEENAPDEDGPQDMENDWSDSDDSDESTDSDDSGNSGDSDDSSDSSDDGTESFVTDEDIQEAFNKALEEFENDPKSFEEESEESSPSNSASESAPLTTEHKSKTQEAFNKSLEESEPTSKQFMVRPTTSSRWKKSFKSHKSVMANRKAHIQRVQKGHPDDDWYRYDRVVREVTPNYVKFQKDSKKKVGILVREFEQRKAAYQYSRARVSRSGSIDVTKLHKYKYDDQIFSTVTTLADAKSHGMIFLVDYSGSMNGVLSGVLLQILNLTEFCDKVGIPYTVISFTSDHGNRDAEEAYGKYEIKSDDVIHNELLSSEMKKDAKRKARFFLFAQANTERNRFCSSAWFVPTSEGLGGTPLDTSLANIGHIVERFRNNHKVQKLNCVVLTDGDSGPMDYGGRFDIDYMRRNNLNLNLDGKIYRIEDSRSRTSKLVEIVGQHYDMTMVGFFLPENSRCASYQIQKACSWDRTKTKEGTKVWKKEKHFEKKNSLGYDSYYVLHTDVEIRDEDEFDIEIQDKSGKSMADSRASQNKLAKAFAKHNNSTKNARILMRKFAEIIA